MNNDVLQQFRQKLTAWIEDHLVTQRLPFQRLETTPRISTDLGRLSPDIVLWINRASQLAGSMILLPAKVNDQLLNEGAAMAKALGLGHFTTWAARDVTIWELAEGKAEMLKTFPLPPAHQIQPEDFEWTLAKLLEELKIVAVNTSPPAADFTPYYFVNLCLRNLHDMSDSMEESARLTAGETADDNWVEFAPIEKAWMSLWRTLFIIWQKRLPPGLQPNRLEQVFHYAMADFKGDREMLNWISIYRGESPLSDADAVRLHHLAGRISQLGWPEDREQMLELIGLLLKEVAHRCNLEVNPFKSLQTKTDLWFNVQPTEGGGNYSLVTQRSYLAGVALRSLVTSTKDVVLADDLSFLTKTSDIKQTVASTQTLQTLDRHALDTRKVILRNAWPNRRFELSTKTPAWVFDALYLSGITTDSLQLILPEGWYNTHGVSTLWEALFSCYQLLSAERRSTGDIALCLEKRSATVSASKILYDEKAIEIHSHLLTRSPLSAQFWINADPVIVQFLLDRELADQEIQWTDSVLWGAYLYLQTQLGRYIWNTCSGKIEPPEIEQVKLAVKQFFVPLPSESLLLDLSFSGSRINREKPASDDLERDFAHIFGAHPTLPKRFLKPMDSRVRNQRRSKGDIDEVTNKVFVDGTPRFPEHYLMEYYRPELQEFTIDGPLEYVDEFFDKVLLRSITSEERREVSGKHLAEALVLASWNSSEHIELPTDSKILADIIGRYREDLKRLWDTLVRECRRIEPQKNSALKIAKRIWQKKALPPNSHF